MPPEEHVGELIRSDGVTEEKLQTLLALLPADAPYEQMSEPMADADLATFLVERNRLFEEAKAKAPVHDQILKHRLEQEAPKNGLKVRSGQLILPKGVKVFNDLKAKLEAARQ